MPRDRFHHAGSGTIIMSRFPALLPLWDICNDWQFWQKSYFSRAASLATFQQSPDGEQTQPWVHQTDGETGILSWQPVLFILQPS